MGTPLRSAAVTRTADPEPKDLLFIGNLSRAPHQQPVRLRREQRSVEAYVSVNGKTARVLLDSGPNTDIISGDFVAACGLDTFPLEDDLTLQLACMGSRTKLQRGTYLDLKGSKIKERRYFDVANIEGFDMILGTPFLHANDITVHFDGSRAYAKIRGGTPPPTGEKPLSEQPQTLAVKASDPKGSE